MASGHGNDRRPPFPNPDDDPERLPAGRGLLRPAP